MQRSLLAAPRLGALLEIAMPKLTQREFRTLLATVFAALEGSDAIVMRHFSRVSSARKADGSEVTIADKAAERLLRRRLRAAWPADPVFGEEYGGALARTGRCWLVDPIDGTASYVLGMPMFGTLIALIIDGEPVFGCVHLPALRETTYAAVGHGCWLVRPGGRPRRVHVARSRALSDAKVGMTSFKERSWLDSSGAREIAELALKVGRLRMVGDCVQYPLVCRGVLDGAVDPLMKPWDIAAIVPCILEAGGAISDLAGQTADLIGRSSIVAANSDELRREICRAIPRPR
jgi:histidinol-phosphatase